MPNRLTTEDPHGQSSAGEDSENKKVSEVSDTLYGERSAYEVATEKKTRFGSHRNRNIVLVALMALIAVVAIYALFLRGGRKESTAVNVNAEAAKDAEHGDEHGAGEAEEVKLSPEAIAAAGIEIEGVTERPAVALIKVTGSVETNQQQTQQASPLVSGRVERVNVGQGDVVRAGAVLAIISSPEVAEMHGKLREAETRLRLAERTLQRVQRAENRVSVIQAKAKLDEAEATLRRTRRLIELGAGAGKDLVAAEAGFKTAKAEHDYQNNISVNREVQEAQAAVETARVDAGHLRQSLQTLGDPVATNTRDEHSANISLVALRAPVSGTVVERLVNAGAGIQAGTALFTIANISTVWVIANVPESQVGKIRVGTPAEVRSAALGAGAMVGRVNYIDPRLNEETRTARVRIEMANPGERLKAGMFVEVGFAAGTGGSSDQELVVPSAAVQRIENRSVVFVPKDDEAGAFEVREVELGGEIEGYHRVISGLKLGEKVVTKGSFTLKTQKMKGEMGEHGH
ncbi:MAG: efflux RND transporter periplasmic adaptor subunit [Pyrinomonadaceae bacterium]|nr:efflux RND transporter periplasmic adaptor subunit [Pyrinomonadaceae bacterium]